MDSKQFARMVQTSAYESFGPGQSAPSFPHDLLTKAYDYEVYANNVCGTQQVMTNQRIVELFLAESEEQLAALHKWWEANFPVCFAIINSACERGF